jgi:hypothetical protein
MNNYGGFDVDDETGTEAKEEKENRQPANTPLPNTIVDDFKQQFGVSDIHMENGELVFTKDGEVMPNQEFLYKTFKLLSEAYAANKYQSPEPAAEDTAAFDTGESSETSNSFYLDEQMNEPPSTKEEEENYKDTAERMKKGPLGCEGNA